MRRIDKRVSAEVTAAMLARLRQLEVNVDAHGFGMVILLIEPNPDGTARMHLGGYALNEPGTPIQSGGRLVAKGST